MSSTSLPTFYTANSSPSCSSAGRTVNTASTELSDNSYHYSVASVNSYKSRKNVLYPRRVHRQPLTLPMVNMLPECTRVGSPDRDMLAWEVGYLCVDLLPYSETRLLPAGRVLRETLRQERGLTSQRKNEETRHCAELFIMLTREILLKDAIGVEELEGPCRLLHLTFSDILSKSGDFDTPTTSNPNETSLCAPCADTQGPERFAGVLRLIFSVLDAFEAALNVMSPLAASDEALQERRYQVSQNFSAVKDLTMDQYRKVLVQKLAYAHCFQSQPTLKKKKQGTSRILYKDGQEIVSAAPRRDRSKYGIGSAREAYVVQQSSEEAKYLWGIPQAITRIEDGSEVEDGWDFVDFDGQSRRSLMLDLMYGPQGKPDRGFPKGFPRRFLSRFPSLSRVLVKREA